MKKFLSSMFALAAVFCASATPTLLSVSPDQDVLVQNRDNLKVTFTFNEEVEATTVKYMGGSRFNPTVSDGEVTTKGLSKTIDVVVPSTAWGEPVSGYYYLNVTLTSIYDKNGVQVMITETDDDGEDYSYPYTVSADYSSKAEATVATYEGLDPDPAETDVWDVYSDGWGFVNFLFSDTVDIAASQAEVIYYLDDESEIVVGVTNDELWADWDFWTGSYAITVPMTPNVEITKASLVRIKATLYNVDLGNGKQTFTADYTNVGTTPQKAPMKAAASKLSISVEENDAVYDMYGNIVMEKGTLNTMSSLPKGIYVMKGKKYIIR